MKRKFKRKSKAEVMEIDITSLLDILVILLVFLLKSYNASSLKLNLAKDLEMSKSQARKLGEHALIIQVDKNQRIWVKNKEMGSTTDLSKLETFLSSDRKPAAILKSANDESTPKKGKIVNLVFDQDLEYAQIQKVMDTCAQHMYTQFKLIVKGDF